MTPATDTPADGLIPAHAGKTPLTDSLSISRPAHPRSRGENFRTVFDHVADAGSSPLTRGKLARVHRRARDGGLIPAHAGKTALVGDRSGAARAHPRSRGENKDALAAVKGTAGSSPLTRGKQYTRLYDARRRRLIPAHAGKTATLARALSCFWAHPRSRGENQAM